MYELVHTSYFDRRLTKFRRAHPDLRNRVARVFRDLVLDPYQPRLRLHALGGELEGLHAVSVNYEYRLVVTLRVTEREIVLIDIGSHDQVYRRR